MAGRMFVIVSKNNKIFRWRPEKEQGVIEMLLPDSGAGNYG
jgi:hypothetical protein